MPNLDVVTVSLISAGIALIALVTAVVTLWRTHFALLKPIAVVGQLRQRVYPIRSEDEQWYLASFDVPLSLCNPGAQPLLVQGVRLRLHFPEIPIPDNYELMHAEWEIRPEDARRIDKNRFQWLRDLAPLDWMPFSVLPKATVTKHLILEARWNDPVIQDKVIVNLEVLSTASKRWESVGGWQIRLNARTWASLANDGTCFSHTPTDANAERDATNPKDLHKYTGSKDPIPKRGLSAPPSYLNYQDRAES